MSDRVNMTIENAKKILAMHFLDDVPLCTDCPAYDDPVCKGPYEAVKCVYDYLVANGVEALAEKTFEEFLHPIDAYSGLKSKYLVFKADTGEKVENCFVLRPDKDLAAVAALRAYAEATDNETLADDIFNWVGKGVAVQITGETSDGYHTFNELYHHRAVLFSVICNVFPELAWKSKQHDDPASPMYEGMFIVGIQTPAGQATYHYDIEPYWDMFHVKELERAPVWDGHTPAEAIRRIGTLTTLKEDKHGQAG